MVDPKGSELEGEIRARCEADDYDAAVTRLLEGYGGELLGFLVARLGDETTAAEVFSLVAERLWRGLESFEWRTSARAFSYAVTRNTANTYARGRTRRDRRELPLSRAGALSEVVEQVCTRTLPFLRTEVKDRVQALRRELPEEDQTLLILRIDRKLPWREVAAVLGGEALDDAALTRESARLRQRFQAIKTTLRERAKREGLLPSPEA